MVGTTRDIIQLLDGNNVNWATVRELGRAKGLSEANRDRRERQQTLVAISSGDTQWFGKHRSVHWHRGRARRRLERLWLTFTSDLRDGEDRWSQQRVSGHLPGSLFDARYKGLTADAAGIDAAIMCRREPLRYHPRCVKDEVLLAHPTTRS
jgi:hypothetical protein